MIILLRSSSNRSGPVLEFTQFVALGISQHGQTTLVVPEGPTGSEAITAGFLVYFVRVDSHGRAGLDHGIFGCDGSVVRPTW